MPRHQDSIESVPRRILITGASGLVGSRLTAFLTDGGHEVHPLVRRDEQSNTNEISWDPAGGRINAAKLEDADAVVNLAGANIGAARWSEARKELILRSRVDGTKLLCSTLAKLNRPPKVLISASAVGYYGDRGDEPLDEDKSAGQGFLSEVCRQWEAATEDARQAGIRVVNLRFGVVLGSEGGALTRMLTPFKLGLGGVIGSGRQYMSWIALDDLVGCINYLMFNEQISGPVNAVAPEPVTNAQFAATLGRVLHRPTLIPFPAFMVRLLLGEMGKVLLLEGARVYPRRLRSSGFKFSYPDLESALRHALGCMG